RGTKFIAGLMPRLVTMTPGQWQETAIFNDRTKRATQKDSLRGKDTIYCPWPEKVDPETTDLRYRQNYDKWFDVRSDPHDSHRDLGDATWDGCGRWASALRQSFDEMERGDTYGHKDTDESRIIREQDLLRRDDTDIYIKFLQNPKLKYIDRLHE